MFTTTPEEDTGPDAIVVKILCKHVELTTYPDVEEFKRDCETWEKVFET